MATVLPDTTTAPTGRRAIDGRYLLYFYLHSTGFLISTLLITWGLFFLFFLGLGGFSIDGLMHQLANLASRYVAADAARVAAFKHTIFIAHMVVTIGVVVFRRHRILPARRTEGSTRHG